MGTFYIDVNGTTRNRLRTAQERYPSTDKPETGPSNTDTLAIVSVTDILAVLFNMKVLRVLQVNGRMHCWGCGVLEAKQGGSPS